MNTERWRRIEDLFDLLADLPETEQIVRLQAECGGDGQLLAEVLKLLDLDRSHHGRIAGVIEGLARTAPPRRTRFLSLFRRLTTPPPGSQS